MPSLAALAALRRCGGARARAAFSRGSRAAASSSSSSSRRDDDDDRRAARASRADRPWTSSSSSSSIGASLRAIALARADAVAVASPTSPDVTYGALLAHASKLARAMRRAARGGGGGGGDGADDDDDDATILRGARVGIVARPGPGYVSAMHATWMNGAIAVPLATSHAAEETTHVLRDAGVRVVAHAPGGAASSDDVDDASARLYANAGVAAAVVVPPFDDRDRDDARHARRDDRDAGSSVWIDNAPSDPALIIYTSGTTGKPKGATHTHASLAAQCDSLAAAWEWRDDDLIYHALPLHHIHGIVNAWMCAHYVGARVEFGGVGVGPERRRREGDDGRARAQKGGGGFSPRRFWSRTRDASEPRITVFMGVPTMYVMLLRTLTALDRTPGARETATEAVKALRLTVSGSAACPVPTQTAWRETTGGDVLLERYGMTEIGMALSNPLRGTRTPGAVGTPLPGVEVKIVEEERAGEDEEERRGVYGGGEYARGPGELLVRGPGVFDGYWNDPEKTRDSFDDEGYFRTGDTAAVTREGAYVILGRTSVDVFNTGGHKVSALEIEAKLLEHPEVREVAVVGLPDDAYGEIAAAIVVLRDGDGDGGDGGGGGGGENVDVARVVDVGERERDLRAFCAKDLASHKVPRTFVFAEKIPRNAMGKVNKKTLRKTMFPTVDFSA